MTTTLEIVLIIGFIILVVLAVSFITKVNKTLTQVQENIDDLTKSFTKAVSELAEIKTQAITTMQMIDKTAEEFIDVSNDIQEQFHKISSTFDPLKQLVSSVTERITPPVQQVSSIFAAASKAISAFSNRLMR